MPEMRLYTPVSKHQTVQEVYSVSLTCFMGWDMKYNLLVCKLCHIKMLFNIVVHA